MSCSPCATSPRPPPASNSPEAGRAPGPSPPSRPGGGPVRVPGPRPRQPRPRTAGALLAPSSRPDPTTSSHSGHQRKSTTDRGGTSCSPCRRSALLRSALDHGAWEGAPPRCPCSRSTAWAPRVPAGPAVHLGDHEWLPAPAVGPAPTSRPRRIAWDRSRSTAPPRPVHSSTPPAMLELEPRRRPARRPGPDPPAERRGTPSPHPPPDGTKYY